LKSLLGSALFIQPGLRSLTVKLLAISAMLLFLGGCNDIEPTGQGAEGQLELAQRTAVVFLGDSITSTWVLPVSSWINAGHSGDSSEMMFKRFDTDVMAENPRVLHILAGTNDVRDIQGATVNYVAIMADQAAASGACVILGTIPPNVNWQVSPFITSQEQMDALTAQWNAQIVALAGAQGYQIADYHAALSLPDGSQNSALFADGTHPNAQGHMIMSAIVQPMVSRCMDNGA
jgi:lysophospholipase L1-like esterase